MEKWGPPEHFVLVNDESLWHRSWAPSKTSLNDLLKNSASYGFSFVGFSEEVTGKISMDQFEVHLAAPLGGTISNRPFSMVAKHKLLLRVRKNTLGDTCIASMRRK